MQIYPFDVIKSIGNAYCIASIVIVKEDCIVVVQCYQLYLKRGDAVYVSIIVVDATCCYN